jgi:hypothetical protein
LVIGDSDVRERDRHRRAARRLERRRQRQRELRLAVLHRELTLGGNGLLVHRLVGVPMKVESAFALTPAAIISEAKVWRHSWG